MCKTDVGPSMDMPVKPSRPEIFFVVGRFLTTLSVSLIPVGLFRLSVSSSGRFYSLYFQGICPFHLSC